MNTTAASQPNSKTWLASWLAAHPAFVVFLLCAVLGLATAAWRSKTRAEGEHVLARAAAASRGAAVESQFSQAVAAAEVLGALARQSGGPIPNFQGVASELLAARPGLASLELQPRGVVSEIVPRAGHERVIGFNVLNDPTHRIGAYAAVQKRVLTVTGPLPLYRGEPGIVVRVPVLQKAANGRETLWGFVAVSMRLTDALARARVDELSTQGYDYAFTATTPVGQKPVIIAARGASSLEYAVRIPVRAQDIEFGLAVQRRGGWIDNSKLLTESIGALAVSGLCGLLVGLLGTRRTLKARLVDADGLLAREAAERERAQQECHSATEATASAQAQLKQTQAALQQAEAALERSHAQLDQTARGSQEARESLEARLSQAEQEAIDLAARLDAAARATDEATKERQAEVARAYVALEQAQRKATELQTRLEEANHARERAISEAQIRFQRDEATVADLRGRFEEATRVREQALAEAQAQMKRDQAAIANLQSRLDAALHSGRETDRALTEAEALIKRDEATITDLQSRLDAAARSGEAVAQALADAKTQMTLDQATIADLQSRLDAANHSGKESARALAEAEIQVKRAEASIADLQSRLEAATQSGKETAHASEAVFSPAEEKLTVAPNPEDAAPSNTPPASEAVPPPEITPEVDSISPSVVPETASDAASPASEASSKKASTVGPKRKKPRRDDQLDLFAEPPAAGDSPGPETPFAVGAPPEESATEASLTDAAPQPPSAVSTPTESESPSETAVAPIPAEAGEPEGIRPEPQPDEPQVVTSTEERGPAIEPPGLDLPAIEGLATAEGLERSDGRPERYVEALRHFAEHQARAAAKIRDALVLGDTTAAEQIVGALKTAASGVGAVEVQAAADTLEQAIHAQSDSARIESQWVDLERALDGLIASLHQALKPEEEKSAHARPLPAQPPINLGHLRKAVRLIMPLLAGEDPGAKDCLKDNRATFRSAFVPEAYAEFEQSVKSGDFTAALDHLKKAAKKHGIAL